MKRTIWLGGAYLMLAIITLVIYWQGLHSDFFLDDIPNLAPMGDHLSLGYWHNLLIFLLEGKSGPTGRPLSLLTFYLNSSSFPANPWSFKLVNVFIHIFNGGLIVLVLYKITSLIHIRWQEAKWLIIFTVSFWLLHPFQITTVLYVIQRMTELSALFMLLGILVYIYGREWLTHPYRKKQTIYYHFLLLSASVWICLILAMLSKETGILLLGYILSIEYFLLRPFKIDTSKAHNTWVISTIFIPFFAILGYIYWGALSPHAFDSRPFTLEQRLLTETRVIFDYLANILIPGFSIPSLFHDDFPISTGWLHPWTTLTSILGLLLLISIAGLMRIKHAVLSFSIIWFLVSHLIESTVVPLELYFEHRNYLALLGPMLAIIYYTQRVISNKPKIRKPIYVLIVFFSLTLISHTLQNTLLWSKPLVLVTTWVKEHPHSIRLVETLDTFEKRANRKIADPEIRKSLQLLNKKQKRVFFLTIRQLVFSCKDGTLTNLNLQKKQEQLAHTKNERASAKVLHDFIKAWQAGKCPIIKPQRMITFLESLLVVPQAEIGTLKHVAYFGLSEVWKTERNLDKTIYYLTKSYEQAPSLDLLFMKVDHFISAGLYNEANATINNLSLLGTTFRKRLVLKLRKEEIDTVRNEINHYRLQAHSTD